MRYQCAGLSNVLQSAHLFCYNQRRPRPLRRLPSLTARAHANLIYCDLSELNMRQLRPT